MFEINVAKKYEYIVLYIGLKDKEYFFKFGYFEWNFFLKYSLHKSLLLHTFIIEIDTYLLSIIKNKMRHLLLDIPK